jgi:hypothetical protein
MGLNRTLGLSGVLSIERGANHDTRGGRPETPQTPSSNHPFHHRRWQDNRDLSEKAGYISSGRRLILFFPYKAEK